MSVDARHTSLSDYMRSDSPDIFAKAVRFGEFLADGQGRDIEKYLHQFVTCGGATALVRNRVTGDVHDVQIYCSADYLDLARHPAVVAAARDAIARFGASVSSVPLIAGATVLHDQLEKDLASFLGAESCVLFPTGQAANASTIAALCCGQDLIVIDKQVHYSILEGVKLSGAKWKSFRHSDTEHLDAILTVARERHCGGILVIIEGVYGLDGDIAPLPRIQEIVRRHAARLFVDDAHATGVLGARGAGTADHFGLRELPDLLMGSFSKAFGSVGGFVAASRHVTDYLRYFGRSIAFSIGLPPANVGAALQSLTLIRDQPEHVERARARSEYLRKALLRAGFSDASRSQSAIMSILVGSEIAVKEATRDLFNSGVWVEGLSCPAVARGHERLRFRVRPCHTDDHLDRAVHAAVQAALQHGFLKRTVAVPGAFTLLDGRSGNTGRLLDLIYKAAVHRSLPASWFTVESKRKLVEKSHFWGDVPFDQAWFPKGSEAYTAAVCATSGRNGHGTVGGLSQFAWLPGHDADIRSCVADGLAWLKNAGAKQVLSPWQAPMQLLGAGLTKTPHQESRPFLESASDPQLAPLLTEYGFRPAWSNTYLKVGLATLPARHRDDALAAIEVRNIDREHLPSEVAQITPLLNETVSTIPGCTAISERFLYGIASELRDLIVPGFWRLAFQGDVLVGFIASFPNVTEAFSQAWGMADIADLVNVNDSLDRSGEGFVGWLGVSPRMMNGDRLAHSLLGEVLDTMRRRGFKEAWLSWELHDGRRKLVESDFCNYRVVDRLDYQVYSLDMNGIG